MQDKTPGISLHHKAESSLQVDCSNQVWLELFQAPFVKNLSLQGTDSGEVHVYIADAPELRVIDNPSCRPLVLHLDLTRNDNALVIEGPISHIDMCWSGGDYIYQHKAVLMKVIICPIHLLQRQPDEQGDLATWLHALDSHSLLLLYAANENFTDTILKLETAAQVAVVGVDAIETITTAHRLPRLLMRKCRNIKHLYGGAERATLVECGKNQLCFHGRWETLELVDCPAQRFSLDDGNSLVLRGRCQIEQAQAPEYLQVTSYATNRLFEQAFPSINESTLRHLYDLFLTSNGVERDVTVKNLISGILKSDRRSTYYHSVQLLSLIAQQSADYDTEVFHARRTLLQKRGWTFGKDLGVEGWIADLKLWLALRERQSVEWLQRHFIENLSNAECFYAAIQTLLELADPTLFELALGARNRQLRSQNQDVLTHEMMSAKVRKRLLIALPRLRPRSQRRIADYFLLTLLPNELAEYTPRLFRDADAAMRAAAIQCARLKPALSSYYTALALSSFHLGVTND